MKKLLHDYGIPQDTMCIFYDNTSAMNLSKNPIQHLSTQTIKRRTSSPSLSMVHGLNPSIRPLVLVQSLESLMWCVLHLLILCYFVYGSHITLLAICIAWSYWLLIALSVFVVFTLLLLINLFLILCQKFKNHIKSRKSKVWLTLLSFVSKLILPCTFVLMALCIYERSLFLCTLITVEEILKSMWLL